MSTSSVFPATTPHNANLKRSDLDHDFVRVDSTQRR